MPEEALRVAVVRNYAYIANGETGLRIVDVSDPALRLRPASMTRR